MTLNELMIKRQATDVALAERSGFAVRTVSNARRGLPVKPFTMGVLLITLKFNDFKYNKRGPKVGSTWKRKK